MKVIRSLIAATTALTVSAANATDLEVMHGGLLAVKLQQSMNLPRRSMLQATIG